ncbi:MAG: DUF2382 domain-containing protein [Bdellovibrionia bacterium]
MMFNREKALTRFQGMSEGTPVYTQDNERLGKITSLDDDSFTVEKGIFFPKDFVIRYDDIQDIQDKGIYLNLTKDELNDWKNESYQGWSQVDEINQGRLNAQPKDEYKDKYQDRYRDRTANDTSQVRVPIAEEELQASKTIHEAGRLKLRKLVHTELRHFTIPVMREEVRVDRVKVPEGQTTTANRNAATDQGSFREQEVNIPVMEEEITVSKRPIVKEEVRVSKERMTEERPVSGEIRKEEVRIEGEDTLKRKKSA